LFENFAYSEGVTPSFRLTLFATALVSAATVYGQPFQQSTFFTSVTSGAVLAAGDFNKDGRSDLAIAGRSGGLEIRYANAQGDFPTINIIGPHPGSSANDMRAADLDGDGKLELVIANGNPEAGAIYVLRQSATVPTTYEFDPRGPYELGANAERLAIADFNLDGRLDIAAQSAMPAIHTLLQTPDGRFAGAPGSPRAFDGIPAGIAAGDFNGDGKPDLVYASQLWFGVLLGNGDGSFATAPGGGMYTHSPRPNMDVFGVAAADFDKDGKLDFAGGTMFDVFWGNGAGNFERSSSSGNVIVGEVAQAADFNGDGRPDFLGTSGQAYTQLLLSDGQRGFNLAGNASISLPSTPSSVTIGDFNGGGRPDFAVAGAFDSVVWTYRNLNAAPSPQTITFAPIPNKQLGDPPFPLVATASSGLPVTFNVVSGPATVQGNILTITGIGTVTVDALQAGSANFSPASARQTFTVGSTYEISGVIHGASFNTGVLAPASYAAIQGLRFPANPTVQFVDAQGMSAPGTVTFISATQINVVLPSILFYGAGTVTVQDANGQSNAFPITIGPVSPGLFMVDPAQSFPAAQVIVPNSPPTTAAICGGTPVVCTLNPINIPANGPAYLVLYGTGIRGATLANVKAQADATVLTVEYAGAAGGTYPGLDQVNVVLPPSLRGRGVTTMWITVQGLVSNTVKVNIR
jgi:uncharacterized protein (TIGR03437 family)